MSNIKLSSKLISINSSNALLKNNGTFNSDVLFKFPGLIKPEPDITHIQFQLIDAQIPVSFYNVNYTNNTLNYQISSINYSITATPGNYNFNSLATQLISKFLANGHIFTVSINKQTGIISISTPATNFILQVSSMFSILGLTLSNHLSISFTLTADFPLNLLGVTKLKIQSINLCAYNADSATNGYSNNIAILPVDQPSFGLIIYENKSNALYTFRDSRLDEIDIQITDQNENLINFNNIDWNLTILLTITREIQTLSKTDMADVLKQQNKLFAEMMNQQGQQNQPPPPQTEQPINPIQTDDLEFFVYSNPNLII
jgi:hypothetical protein